ncbi:aldo/keto reductase [Saccharopolyspora sp. ASAGF58]|uniref:aldo/keto reductase n=1 Tax=Saccharopolyspora sp. ASAGF58 TaxID=2719023 RepID=UPI002110F601|nr:aldo/keto reductase [Saccharopolyspora sp. ASAGF58]
MADQLGVLTEMRGEGKIRHIGLSKVTIDQINQALSFTPIAAVQNRFNANEGDRKVLDYCTRTDTAFVPYAPLDQENLAQPTTDADGTGQLSPAQRTLAWLLGLSPVVLPIPGTASLDHLAENLDTPIPLADVVRG